MEKSAINYKSQKMGIWCAWIFTLCTVVGWLGIANFISPAAADLGQEETRVWFQETHQWGTIVGCTIFYIGCGFLIPASIQFGLMLSRVEGKWPLWSITAAVGGTFIALIVFLNACAWIVASYRKDTGADVVQALNDWAWMAFLLGWIMLAVEMLASAIVEFQDKSEDPMIPRWLAWFTLLGSFILMTAMGPAFFKSGPFAYHGLLGFYLPMAVWGAYLNLTAWYMYKALSREEAAQANTLGQLA